MKLIKKTIVVLAIGAGVLAIGGPALAQEPPPPVTLDAGDVSTIALAAPIVSLIVGLLIPVLNGLLTKVTTSSGVKALLTLGLSTISAIVTNGLLADGSSVFTTQTLYTALITYGVAVLSYVGAYKPLGVTSSLVTDKATGTVTEGKLAEVGRH